MATQAQIEAAIVAFCKSAGYRIEPRITEGSQLRRDLTAALTAAAKVDMKELTGTTSTGNRVFAAAEVGEQSIAPCDDAEFGTYDHNANDMRNATIERCARVADTEEEPSGDMPPELHLVPIEDAIRAAIRATKKSISRRIMALKNKP